jgi:sugar phosphate isomerase/epimerase
MPSRPLVSTDLVLASGTIRAATLEETVVAASQAGFAGISVYYDEYVAARRSGWTDAGLADLLDDQAITVAELDGRMDWLPGDSGNASAEQFIAAADALGARSITVLETEGRRVGLTIPWDDAAAAFAALCDRADGQGLLAHIEFFPFSGIPDLSTAYEVVRRAERSNGGVMIDTWHLLRGPDAGRIDPAVPGSAVLAVQVGDVAELPDENARFEMMHARRLPGRGVGPLPLLLSELRARGCTAPIEVEVYSDELAGLEHDRAADLAGQALRQVVESAGLGPQVPTSTGRS